MAGEFLSLLGAGGNLLSNYFNNLDIRQMNQESIQHENAILESQYRHNEEAAQAADTRTRALYSDLMSPSAKMKQLEEAGLSIGMMYGQGGAGGSLTSGAQATAPSAIAKQPIAPRPIMDAQTAQIIANAEKTKAETDEIKSRTELNQAELPKKQAETEQIKKLNEKTKQDIEESVQRINNMVADKEKILEETNNLKEYRNLIQSQTKYQSALERLTNLQADELHGMNEAQKDYWKSQMKQFEAAAEKLGVEKETIQEQKIWLVQKAMYEALMAHDEYQYMKPAELQKIRAETQKLDWGNLTEKQIQDAINQMGLDKGTAGIVKGLLYVAMAMLAK